jgi:hypothetical protein
MLFYGGFFGVYVFISETFFLGRITEIRNVFLLYRLGAEGQTIAVGIF